MRLHAIELLIGSELESNSKQDEIMSECYVFLAQWGSRSSTSEGGLFRELFFGGVLKGGFRFRTIILILLLLISIYITKKMKYLTSLKCYNKRK